ncbi:universal stress protein [Oscillatoria sp. CS-180]|uniref:universal stress protein n=1 Tax=Oscillatoria sp. CS-180 TaxID=3021720 RepID=UPI00232C5951|nr:universal stress protein [Oscillatoria sp. CS-180]MDB9527062.1 universal stress protein [Oscillatoria sp. CS-180]
MYKRILVALDHSSLRTPLMDKAMSVAKAMSADLMLVRVLSAYEDGSPGLPVRAYHSYYPISDSAAWDTYQKRWETYEQEGIVELRQFAADAMTQGVKTEFTQVAGDPGRVICDIAQTWNADLVIVGSRGRSGLSEFFLGSVSNYVMHHATCSVLVAHGLIDEAPASAQDTQSEVQTAADAVN